MAFRFRIYLLLLIYGFVTALHTAKSFVLQNRAHNFRHNLPDRCMMHTFKKKIVSRTAMPSPVTQDGRTVPSVSAATFLATVASLPVWALTVLPLSLFYQAGKVILKPVLPKAEQPRLDTGYHVSDSDVLPRRERKYDMVVLGATGFTGRLAVRHLAKTYGVNKSVKWAIAGRSEAKLDKVKRDLADELDIQEVESIDTIIVDTTRTSSMPALVKQARCVATTAGPFALFGSPVVEFCAKFGTHYVDITGESDWVKAMIMKWGETAQKSGARLVTFCGHDSVPWDLSVMKLQEALQKEFKDDLTSVTFWDEAVGGAPGGTIATLFSAVDGKSVKAPHADFDPFLRLMNGKKSEYVCRSDGPTWIHKSKSPWDDTGAWFGRWTTPFIMAQVNGAVVRWSHALREQGSKSLTYTEFAVTKDFKTAFVNHVGLIIVGSMMLNPLTSGLLKKYVFPKVGEGPSMKNMEDKHYLCIFGEGIGINGNRAESIMYFDKDAGCLETSRMLVESGLCLALEEDKVPAKHGGFWPPAAGLGNVLLKRLLETGTSFEARAISEASVRHSLE